MRNHIKLGPVILRIRSKHLAPWGFPRIKVGGLSIWSWTNSGQFVPASYHAPNSLTWSWAVWVGLQKTWGFRVWGHGGPSQLTREIFIGPFRIAVFTQERTPRRDQPPKGQA